MTTKKTSKAKKITLVQPTTIPTPVFNNPHSAIIDLHQVLRAITYISSTDDVYSFLLSDLKSKIKENDMNATYWKNQIAYIKKNKEEGVGFKSYQLMVKSNQATNKQYRKAVAALTKAHNHFIKGNHQ